MNNQLRLTTTNEETTTNNYTNQQQTKQLQTKEGAQEHTSTRTVTLTRLLVFKIVQKSLRDIKGYVVILVHQVLQIEQQKKFLIWLSYELLFVINKIK